jgi:dTDP-4-dehydrorhamnose reductase
MKEKILITGSNGLLGQKLIYSLKHSELFEVIATSRGENRLTDRLGYAYVDLDITQKNQIENILARFKPDVIINTAAMTNVDACETQRDECWSLNVNAVAYFIEAIQSLHSIHAYNPHFIHLSTDFIFDGTKGPLTEDEIPNPLSFYAESKLAAEKLLQESSISWAIARTVLVYGIADNMSRSNIVLWAKSALEQNKKINVVDDQFRTPTLAEDLAEGCIKIARQKAKGIFNISGKDYMSILELVYRVADFWGLNKNLITPSKSDDIRQPAKRPPNTGFIIEKARKNLGYEPHTFEQGLQKLDDQLRK